MRITPQNFIAEGRMDLKDALVVWDDTTDGEDLVQDVFKPIAKSMKYDDLLADLSALKVRQLSPTLPNFAQLCPTFANFR